MSLPTKYGLLAITLSIIFFASSSSSSQVCNCDIAFYWGQRGINEGPFRHACDSVYRENILNFKIIMLSSLDTFGQGRTPVLNLTDHCDPASGSCVDLSSDIEYCQRLGIKVQLSIGGSGGSYGLDSTDDAQQFADYLWNTYLAGNSSTFRPLGPAILDGIDFNIESGSNLYYDDLARFLNAHSTDSHKIYLSTAPYCPFPDPLNNNHIQTGLFHYIFIRFYDDSCGFDAGADAVLAEWNTWTSSIPTGAELFLGLPPKGGILPWQLNFILRVIKRSKNYGGVMLLVADQIVYNMIRPEVCPLSCVS